MKSSLMQLAWGSLLLVLTVVIGIIGYLIAGWSMVDSIYMVVITIFGVGYGEVQPITDSGLKLFTILIILSGCSCLIYIIGAVIQLVTEGQIQRALGKRRMDKEIKNLNQHVIICGFGRIGRLVAAELAKAHRDFIIVDKASERLQEIEERHYRHIFGDAVDERTLIAAGIQRAAVLASVLPDDASNVFVTLTARNLNPNLMIIARGDVPTTEPKLKQAGANKVVLPIHIGAERVSSMIIHPNVDELIENSLISGPMAQQMGDLGLNVEQITISPGSSLIDKQLVDLETKEKCAFLVVGIRRQDGRMITKPPLKTRIEEGDRLIVMCHRGIAPQFTHKQNVKKVVYYRGVEVVE